MNIFCIVKQSLLHYHRTTLGIFVGCLLTSMIITGTLLVGDSASQTLTNIALARLGKTDLLLYSRNRFFNQDLAGKLAEELTNPTSAILLLNGVAIRATDAGSNMNSVNVIGIDDTFNNFHSNKQMDLADGEIAINEKTARRLAVKAGDQISIRVEKPGILPRDAPLSSRIDSPFSRGTFIIKAVVSDQGIGRFSPKANQVIPNNVFVRLPDLQRMAGLPNKANMILLLHKPNARVSVLEAENLLEKIWSPEDFGLKLRHYAPENIIQMENERVFFDEIFMDITSEDAIASLTYMVNGISLKTRSGENSIPYSFAIAIGSSTNRSLSPVPAEMNDDQALINRWLANHLKADKGDTISVSYYAIDSAMKLTEHTRSFSVFDIIEMEHLRSEQFLAPDFPGLSDVDSCKNWDVGIPMKEELLNNKPNEEYWNTYKGAPKAFFTLKAGQEMWGSRFGNITAIRFPGSSYNSDRISQLLRSVITPTKLGFYFQPARDQAQTSASKSMDLGQLFTGMSFFLIIAALTLTALLFSLGVNQRSEEIGVLLAIGFEPARIRTLFLLEASIIAFISSIAGAATGVIYTRFLLWGLSELWSDAVANSSIAFHASALSPVIGTLSSFLLVMIVIVLSIHIKARAGAHNAISQTPRKPAGKLMNALYSRRLLTFVFSLLTLFALSLIVYATSVEDHAVNTFYIAGTMLLMAGIGFTGVLLSLLDSAAITITAKNFGFKNAAWRPGRSIAVTAMLACGVFMVFSIFAMRQDLSRNADKTWSGTGGFELFATTTLPVLADINTHEGKEVYRLNTGPFKDNVTTVCIKVRDGDDASCFNLNRSLTPTVLGIDHKQMSQMNAFVPKDGKDDPWQLLRTDSKDGTIPALAGDSNTAIWGLQKKTDPVNGDIITMKDESGTDRQLKLTGTLPMHLSVFQGTILISKENFSRLFPSQSGYQMFLIKAPEEQLMATAVIFRSRLSRLGVEIEPAVERLEEFYSVESAYLSMFLLLGGLGLLLGTAGLSVILTRNTLERRSELALMRCIGFSRSQVETITATEYICLIIAGMSCGIIAAVTAIWPNLRSVTVDVPWGTMVLLASGILFSGIIFTFASIRIAAGGPLLSALREE